MKEIDTETSVVWPSWCYSDNLRRNILKEYSQIDKDLYDEANIGKRLDYQRLSEITELGNKKAEIDQKKAYIAEKKMLSERSLLLNGYCINNTIESVKPNCEQSNTPLLTAGSSAAQRTDLTITPTAAAAAYLYLEKVKNERMSPRVATADLDSLKDAIMESSAAASVAAAMLNNNNNINNNNNNTNSINNHNNNNNNDSINISNSNSNLIISGRTSSTASNCSNSSSNISNLVNNQIQSSTANHTVNDTSDDLPCHSLKQSTNHTQQQHQQQQQQQQQHQIHKHQQAHQHLQSLSQQQQQQQSLHMSNNNVKKERLSPGTNGDLQTSLSRSRSTTPSSFRGTSPQQSIHSSPSDTLVPMHNLSTNLLNSIHQASAVSSNRQSNLGVSSSGLNTANTVLPTDFSTRNYSDFMRSLAAKYNNTNTNDNLKRNSVFEATTTNSSSTTQKKTSISAQKTSSFASIGTTPINKDASITSSCGLPPPPPMASVSISPGESSLKLTQQNKFAAAVANAAAVCSSNVSPYMTSFLSSLPFSPVSLIDMSSTQALITLARAAKENEIHYILNASAPHQKRPSTCISPTSSPTINMALQQAAQFISPALIYSSQLQKQLQQQQQQQVSRQSSPRLANFSNSTSSCTSAKNSSNHTDKMNVSPLDLSSQPPAAKRFKAESTSSHSSADGQINSTITRRASSSTATSSPSPPPFKEKSPSASISADMAATPIIADSGSTTKPEVTTSAACTPIKKIPKSTSPGTTSTSASVAPAVAVRQCQAQSEELNSWTVDDVCAFVRSIDICAEYESNFRDQCIDGSGLPLLTEDHLVNSLGLKLGPALKLRSVLAKKLGGPCPCVSCIAQVQQVLALQSGNMTAAPSTVVAATVKEGPINDTNRNVSITDNSNNSHCNRRRLHKKSLTISSDINCSSKNNDSNKTNNNNNNSVDQDESTTSSANANSINTATELNLSDSNAVRSGSNCTANIGNISSPPPQQPPQQHSQRQTPSQNICNNNNNSNPTTNRHDNVDSSS